jgi:hypothetical protein
VGADGLPLALAGLWERWKDRLSANAETWLDIAEAAD